MLCLVAISCWLELVKGQDLTHYLIFITRILEFTYATLAYVARGVNSSNGWGGNKPGTQADRERVSRKLGNPPKSS